VEDLLGQPGVLSNQKEYRSLTQEHAYLSELKEVWNKIGETDLQLEESSALLKSEQDLDFQEMIREEISKLEEQKISLANRLEILLVPPDPNDNRNVILELRAGTGGDEAAIFVGDCVRMYKCYADVSGWSVELLSSTPSELGGFKEYIMLLSGSNVHRLLQYEAGTHRVQRVPKTESQGRVHTSAITVAVLVEPDEEEEVDIDESELRIDTYRSSGAGGQHVNTTDSAVRITHLPTGTVVYCQEERSQHKNKDKAMRLLVAKIAEEKRRKLSQERSDLRASQVGSGDRSERIRTYNFPQNRVTDHRIDLTLYKLDRVMDGDLQEITNALVKFYHQQKLAG
jgi:peptide chain release factor 1